MKIECPDRFQELHLRFFGLCHQKTTLVCLNPVIIEIFVDLLLLFLVDQAIGPHVDQFFEIVFRENMTKASTDIDFVFIDLTAFIHHDKRRLLLLLAWGYLY